jgi:hypothetical protein
MSGTEATSAADHVDPAFKRKPQNRLLNQIEALQEDGLLLLDHLTKRHERRFTWNGSVTRPDAGSQEKTKEEKPTADPVVTQAPADTTGTSGSAALDPLSLGPLTRSPFEIADDKGQGLRDLVLLVDALARLAHPVTPRTIRNSRDRRLKWLDAIILLVLGTCFVLSIAMLWRADEARNLVTQIRQTQNAANEVFGRLRLIDPQKNFGIECGDATQSCPTNTPNQSEGQALPTVPPRATTQSPASNTASESLAEPRLNYLPFCYPGTDEQGEPNKVLFLAPRSREAESLCSALAQHQIREHILFGRLRAWNCSLSEDSPQGVILSILAKPVSGGPQFDFAGCHQAPAAREDGTSDQFINDWRRSEFRTIAILSLITKHLLPALLALVGACTYLLRLRYRQRSQSLLEDWGWGTLARLLMPAALGGLLSVVWSTGDVINPTTVTIQDLSLSLAFIAFLLGYAFDPVLEWLEGKIRETFLKLNGETKEVKVQ